MARQRILVELDGLISVHAARAAHTALAAVPGIVSAQVSMAGAVLEYEGPLDEAAFAASLAEALAVADLRVLSIRRERAELPLL
jgi:hypothetical protein